MMRQIAPRSVLYRCDRKPLAETIVHFNGAVYTSLIDLTLYLLYEVRGGFFVLLDPPAKIQLKQVAHRILRTPATTPAPLTSRHSFSLVYNP